MVRDKTFYLAGEMSRLIFFVCDVAPTCERATDGGGVWTFFNKEPTKQRLVAFNNNINKNTMSAVRLIVFVVLMRCTSHFDCPGCQGGLGAAKPVDDTVNEVFAAVKSAVDANLRLSGDATVHSYCTQVVAGINFYIKA